MNTANPKPGLASDTTQSAKNLAQQIAKQMVREPWEILKQAGGQLAGTEQLKPETNPNSQNQTVPGEETEQLMADRDKVRSQRLIEALNQELAEIRKAKEEKKKAQLQQEQIAEEQKKETPQPLIEPAAKQGRRLNFLGAKGQAKKQERRVEMPLPPSG